MKHARITLLLLSFIGFSFALKYDRQISLFFQMHRSIPLDILFTSFTHMGTMIALLLLIVTIFFWKMKNTKSIAPLWVSLGTTAFVSYMLKYAVARPRPEAIGIIPVIAETAFSFPSLHSAAAFSSLAILDSEFKSLKYVWIFIAVMIALSRVYLGVHYMSDVIAGGMIGYCIGWLFAEMRGKPFMKRLNALWK